LDDRAELRDRAQHETPLADRAPRDLCAAQARSDAHDDGVVVTRSAIADRAALPFTFVVSRTIVFAAIDSTCVTASTRAVASVIRRRPSAESR
jgi:hypothetical protein